jgi:uncharacterized protein (TIGR02099 family)
LIALAVSLTGVRLLLSGIEHYKADLATHISERLGTPIIIGQLSAKMRGFSPELVLKDIAVTSIVAHALPAVQLKEIRLSVNLLDMLISRELMTSARITLVGAKISVTRKQDGSVAIVGLKAGDGQPLWLFQGGRYEVLQSEITWQDEKKSSRPLLFNEIDLALSNKADHHLLNILIKLPKKIGHNLRVSMDFKGNVFEPSTLQGRFYIDGKAINLSELAAGFDSAQPAEAKNKIAINSGVGDFKIWGDWQQLELRSMDVAAQIHQMVLTPDFSISQLKTSFHWGAIGTGNRWQLDVNEFLLETAAKGVAKKWPAAVFSLGVQQSTKVALFARQLDLQEASDLAQVLAPLPDQQIKKLAQAQLKGKLDDFSLFADLDKKTLAVQGKFAGLSTAAFAGLPGIDNVSGQLQGNEKAGSLSLTTDDAQLIAPDFFREPFRIKKLKGKINWSQTDSDWTISSREFELNLYGLQSTNRLKLILPKTSELPFLDVQSSFVSDDISQAKHYFPTKVMKPEDVVWFDNAFLGGRVTKGELLYVANLGVFPANAKDGVFEALLNLDQLNLSYAPGWPELSNIVGEVTILQKHMTCEIQQGHSNNLSITQATVINPALGTSKLLTVKGEFEGEIPQVFSFLQNSPLTSQVGFLVDAVIPQGNTQVALDLVLPLAEGIMPKVYGVAKFNQASLKVAALDLDIDKIDGELKFTEQGVYTDKLKAITLGRNINVNINKADQQQTFVEIAGTAAIEDLQKKFKMPGWELADGAMTYQLKLGLPYPGSPSEIELHSDLVGVALDLPGLLAKPKSQKKSLSLSFKLGDQKILPIAVNYNNQLKAALQLNLAQHRLHSGHLLIGAGEVEQQQEAGLIIELDQNPLNLQDWLKLPSQKSSENTETNIRKIKIHSQQAQWKNALLGRFDLTLKPEGSYWTGAINSGFATGTLRIPVASKGSEKISLDLATLDLSALKQPETENTNLVTTTKPESKLAPATMPLFSITSQKTLWQSLDLGRLAVETERIPGGMRFKHMELIGQNQKFVVSGDWQASGTHTQGHLEIPHAGQLLNQLGITKDFTETSAAIDFRVNWNAAPYQFSLATLKGRVDVNLKNGRILSIEPGVGRILGILAMEQWLKRAQLDFSDVYKEGLSFNSIKGHFDVLNGIASTHDLVIDAIPAKITINGDADLVGQTVNHVINVTPKSADAVPIAGTIMGKIADVLGRSLTGKDQEGFFFGAQYLVKGSWNNAEIISMFKNGGLLQKTWHGITGFPWLEQEETKEKLNE